MNYLPQYGLFRIRVLGRFPVRALQHIPVVEVKTIGVHIFAHWAINTFVDYHLPVNA